MSLICVTGTKIYRTHISPEHTLGSRLPLALATKRNLHRVRVTNISLYAFLSLQTFSQRKLLSRKAQTVPEETPTM